MEKHLMNSRSRGIVRFFCVDCEVKVSKKRMLQFFLQEIISEEKRQLNFINLIFCSMDYLFELNVKYLNHDTDTDIITFELSQEGQRIEAELYISVESIKLNANKYKTTFQNETIRLFIHGVLHLCGFKDKTKEDKIIMEERENHYLKQFVDLERKEGVGFNNLFHVKQNQQQ